MIAEALRENGGPQEAIQLLSQPSTLHLLQFQGVIVGASILVTLCRKKV